MKPPTHAYLASRRLLFARGVSRGFSSAAQPLFEAIKATKEAIKAASSPDDFPPFTDIAVQYGSLLTQSVLVSYVKGHDAARKRRYRKNSLKLDDVVDFAWDLQNVAAVAAFSRQAFEMAGVQTATLREALFEEAKAVFASGGTYMDWADTFKLHGFEPENPFHLRTNYDTAANAAYAAGQWEQFEALKDLFPYLRYVTMRDDKVRDEHAALDGLVYKVDDIFWLTYMPPNGYNCRCAVEQLMEHEFDPSTQPAIAEAPLSIPREFQNNPGITRQLLYQDMRSIPASTWTKEHLNNWTQYPKSALPGLIDTANLSAAQLMDICVKHLGNRIIYDVNHVPIAFPEAKAEKLFMQGKPLSDIRARFRYLNCIDDTIKNPHEVWLDPQSSRVYYLKRYDKNIAILVDIEKDSQIRYFNIMFQRDKELDNTENIKTRRGILLYKN